MHTQALLLRAGSIAVRLSFCYSLNGIRLPSFSPLCRAFLAILVKSLGSGFGLYIARVLSSLEAVPTACRRNAKIHWNPLE